MENQTRFDLNTAIASWKQELMAQPGISAEDVRELETHLLECIDRLRTQGVGERELFDQARRQIGSIDQLGEEYAKAYPMRTWRERLFWMAFACVAIVVWRWLVDYASMVINSKFPVPSSELPSAGVIAAYFAANGLLPVIAIACVALGWGEPLFRSLQWFCRGRARFLASALGLLATLKLGELWLMRHYPVPSAGWENVSSARLLGDLLRHALLWPGPLVALMTWLIPGRRETASAVEEYNGATSVSLWRERAFWMAVGGTAISCWSALSSPAWKTSATVAYTVFPNSEIPFLILRDGLWAFTNCVPLILGILILRGRLTGLTRHTSRLLRSRVRVALIVGATIIAAHLIEAFAYNSAPGYRVLLLLQSILWPGGLLACILWLLPKRMDRAVSA